MTEANDETACTPLARMGPFAYADPLPLGWYNLGVKVSPFEISRAYEYQPDPWTARTQAVEELAARGFSREDAEAALGTVIDSARWDEFQANADWLYRRARRLARRGPWVPPRGKLRRSRQVRSTRARARRRVEARERRHELEVFEVLGVRFSARRDRASAVESIIRSRVEAREQRRPS